MPEYIPGALATAHYETGPGYRIPCWCEIGRDHTFAEFLTAEEA